jgi:hypothetical protein
MIESAPALQFKLAPMVDEHKRYIAVETAISVAINIGISAAFMFLVFGRSPKIDLWGPHGLALDFIPQTFMITLMSVLIPSLITRRRLKSGLIAGRAAVGDSRLPRNILFRAIIIGCGLTVLLGGCAVLLLSSSWRGAEPFWRVFPFKLVYGALVAAIATPLGLHVTLTEAERKTIQ